MNCLSPKLTVWEHLKLVCDIKQIKSQKIEEEIEDAMQKMMISLYFDQKVEELTEMLRRKLALAMAIVGKPSILFLDEPTLGLDVESKNQFWSMINQMKGRMTTVFTTADI